MNCDYSGTPTEQSNSDPMGSGSAMHTTNGTCELDEFVVVFAHVLHLQGWTMMGLTSHSVPTGPHFRPKGQHLSPGLSTGSQAASI